MPKNVIGIDLGTTFSVVAYVDDQGNAQVIPNVHGARITPSVVVIHEDGRIEVGQAAMNQIIANGSRVCQWIKRRMGDDKFVFCGLSAVQISAEILKYLKLAAEARLGVIDEAVITCPAYFSAREIENTLEAGKLAGLHVQKIVKEPVAAAVRYGLERLSEKDLFVVCDLGGGTYDACIMRMEGGMPAPVATAGSSRLGGKDWTDILLDKVCERLAQAFNGNDPRKDVAVERSLYEACEQAKREFTSLDVANFPCQFQGQFATVQVKRSEFEDWTEEKISEMVKWTDLAIVNKANLTWNDINHIILVGGSSRLRRMKLALKERYKSETDRDIEPILTEEADLIVALGAAVIARGEVRVVRGALVRADAPTALVPVRVKSTAERNLGTKVVEIANGAINMRNSVIIKQGTPLDPPPKCARDDYEIGRDGQETVDVPVVEFDDVGADEIFCTYRFRCPPGIRSGSRVQVTFEYTQNGAIQVAAHELPSRRAMPGERLAYREPNPEDFRQSGPRCIIFVIDLSGSMEQSSKISLARTAVIAQTEQLLAHGSNNRVGVVGFSSTARVIVALTTDSPLVSQKVMDLKTENTTELHLGLREALNALRGVEERVERGIVVVTDGMTGNPEETVRIANDEIRGKGIRLWTLGLGSQEVDEDFLKRLTPDYFVLDDFREMNTYMGGFLKQSSRGANIGKAGLVKWS